LSLTHTGTQPIETERLLLRRFTMADTEDMFREWAGDENVTRYLAFEPHKSAGETKTILAQWIVGYEELNNYQYAIEIKNSSELIGSITVRIRNEKSKTADVGYCIGVKYWNNGYTSEALQALIHYMFYDVGVNRIEAYHSVNNPASGKVMQKAGMYREGMCRQKYMSNVGYQDSDIYGLVREDFDKIYMPQTEKFLDLSKTELTGHNLKLECIDYFKGDRNKKYVPAYSFNIKEKNSDTILGEIGLRLGFNDNLYYGGHIGYSVKSEFRNMGIATIATKIVLDLARTHGFNKIIITNEYMNKASRRVCEKIGAKLVRIAPLPAWHELYIEGQRFVSIYEVDFTSDIVI